MESYIDTPNRVFPWGCERGSEVVTELVRRVCELEDAALELARYARKLTERVEKLEEKED